MSALRTKPATRATPRHPTRNSSASARLAQRLHYHSIMNDINQLLKLRKGLQSIVLVDPKAQPKLAAVNAQIRELQARSN